MESYGPAILRLMVGAMFVAHGMQKLFGSFGGGGLTGTAAYFDAIGLSPGFPLAVAVGVTEFGGGLLLMAGALTRYASVALALVMVGAIWNVHFENGFFMNWAITPGVGHGVEYNLVLVAALLCLALTGPGALSVDHRRSRSAESDAAGRARLLRGQL
ncbi:MAG: DoxX family protein [Vicinamibacterales bacterium]